LCPLFAYGSTVKRFPLVLVLLAVLGACDLADRSKDGASTRSVQRARTADLPTAAEVASIYPGIEERDVYGMDSDPSADKTPACIDDWRLAVPFTSGRWSSYQREGGKDPFFSGGEGPSVDVMSFASVAAATAAVATFTKYVEGCLGSSHGTSDYPFTRRKLDLPAGFVGFRERSVVDVGGRNEDRKDLYIVGGRDEFVVGVRIQTDGVEPNAKRALGLARLARRVVGRAPEVSEPVPPGAVLHDHRDKPLFVSTSGKSSAAFTDLPPDFRKFVRAKASKVEKSVGGEYTVDDCAAGIDVLMYRTDGFAQLGEVNCVGDGAAPGYLVAEVDGAWRVVDEGAAGRNPGGNCAKLAKARFPSSIAGSWCQDGTSDGHEYPTR